jgi:nicotinamidase-related amidase
MTTALLLIDIQNDYFPGGKMALERMDEAGASARSLLEAFRARGLPVIHVRHLSARPGATFFVPGTPGADINPLVSPQAGERVIDKNFPNSFRGTPLADELRTAGIDCLVIAGAMSHMCVDATVRAAFDLGFRCVVAEDACATRALEFNGATIPAHKVHGAFMAALGVPYASVLKARVAISMLNH